MSATEQLRTQGLGDANAGTLWCVRRGKWFSLYIEQWRKANGEVDVAPFGIPNLSLTFLLTDLIPTEY